ncbi:MAG TPA: hypothetical protein VGQ77_10640 [Methylomirabilota bacterium]|jgi:hypothetical protein|nr:hypothetical protein [Methylomirabilota bacterium]
MKRVVARLTLGVLVILAVTGMVLQAGSLPHVHEGDGAGFYNEEHDLTLLAGLAGQVIPVDAAPTITLAAISALLLLFVPERPRLHAAHSGVSRAPPVR